MFPQIINRSCSYMLKRSATEKVICETLIEMMEKRRFDTIKVTEIVKKARISRSAFYVHYKLSPSYSDISDTKRKLVSEYISGGNLTYTNSGQVTKMK